MAVDQKAIVVAEKKPKSAPSHPPYLVMIQEAILSLKERTGSSQYAIAKHIEEKQSSHLPQNFKRFLLVQLKQLVAKGKLVKVKNSFKLAPALKAAKPTADTAAKKPKTATVAKSKVKAAAKPKDVAKPKTAAVAKPGVKAASKPKVVAKPKPALKRKAAVAEKPAKVAKTATTTSPGKKSVAKPKKLVAGKPKSIKSPVKKAAPRKTKK